MTERPEVAVTQKVAKSTEFLLMAEMALEVDAYSAAASLAVTAAINASDALVLRTSGYIPAADDHRQAVTVLRKQGSTLAAQHLSRVLGLKSKAQYHAQPVSKQEAADAVRRSGRLLDLVKESL